MTEFKVRIDITRARTWIVLLSTVVLALGYFREAIVAGLGTQTILEDLRHIALDTEHCLGSWYSSVLMVVIAALLTGIGQNAAAARWRLHRHVLAAVFVFMSLDESVSFHELLIEPLQPLFAFSSYLHFAWIAPGALFVLFMGLSYIPFVFSQPRNVRNGILAAGTIYLTGAIGFEAIGGHFVAAGGFEDARYIASFLIEETLEIAGLTIFIMTLLSDLPRHFPSAAGQPLTGRAAWPGASEQAARPPGPARSA